MEVHDGQVGAAARLHLLVRVQPHQQEVALRLGGLWACVLGNSRERVLGDVQAHQQEVALRLGGLWGTCIMSSSREGTFMESAGSLAGGRPAPWQAPRPPEGAGTVGGL